MLSLSGLVTNMKQLLDYWNPSGQDWRADTLLLKERHGILLWDHPFGFGAGIQTWEPHSLCQHRLWNMATADKANDTKGEGWCCTQWKIRDVSSLMDCHDPNLLIATMATNVALWLYLYIHIERFKLIQCSCWWTWGANCSNLISFNHIGDRGQTHVPTTYWTRNQAFVAVRLWKRTIIEEHHNEASWERDSWCVLSVSSYLNSLIFTRSLPGTWCLAQGSTNTGSL